VHFGFENLSLTESVLLRSHQCSIAITIVKRWFMVAQRIWRSRESLEVVELASAIYFYYFCYLLSPGAFSIAESLKWDNCNWVCPQYLVAVSTARRGNGMGWMHDMLDYFKTRSLEDRT
jgi:1,4-alpha-glucan branching enzyme